MIEQIIKNTKIILLAMPVALLMVSCDPESEQKLDQQPIWSLVWSDEFDENAGTQPSATNWQYDIGTGDNGWGNQELQYYTNDPSNIQMDGFGNLAITAKKENFGGQAYTSARINSKNLFDYDYGRIEARIKIPYGPGIWPAFWMLGADISSNPWPGCGEIDIMEIKGQEPNIVHGSIHGPGYSGGNAITKSYAKLDGRLDTDYHIYAVEKYVDRVDFYIDDYLYQSISKADIPAGTEWVYNKPFYLLFNVAVGGNFVGFPSENTSFPQQMLIDYVRVYKIAE